MSLPSKTNRTGGGGLLAWSEDISTIFITPRYKFVRNKMIKNERLLTSVNVVLVFFKDTDDIENKEKISTHLSIKIETSH